MTTAIEQRPRRGAREGTPLPHRPPASADPARRSHGSGAPGLASAVAGRTAPRPTGARRRP
ncbi:hypothetical protein EHS14_04165 [Schaalia georgiae]|nr:hypothetical protein EHS14_04165 [Schaalia georgiae]